MLVDYNPFSLVDKTILITGSSSGIGETIAVECSKMGANVIVTGRNKRDYAILLVIYNKVVVIK